MMHILATAIFMGALALSLLVIGRTIAGNRARIGAALLGQSHVALVPVPVTDWKPRDYAHRTRRLRANTIKFLTVPAGQRLVA